ncbi:MAG: 16S rRNA (guanine(527)-N(7))-methyltransferase RsmG [Erysipelotrichaceae bacterium]|nr:16S rRNA (guanine(527)-N(7))-methyltransferase RsmG [Erysipelotrichaceae bacterium]
MTKEEFVAYVTSSPFDLSQEQIEQFDEYCLLLQQWNEKMNLTAITETDEIYEKHFLDCLLSLSEEVKGRVIDVGSGAGFPGVVWKIARPELEVVLLEPTGKRVTFLNEVIRKLNLKGITTVNERAEDYVAEARESFDVVTARAVANLPVLSELCLPLVKVGGCFLAMKGAAGKEEAEAARNAIRLLGGKTEAVEYFTLNGAGRYNIRIRKEKATDLKYPRRYDRIKKKPL